MRKDQALPYYLMIALTIVFTLLAIITLVPSPWASKPNILGYRSICPFAPAATALCALLAGLTCTLRNRFVSSAAAGNRRGLWIAPIGVLIILGSLAGFSAFRYHAVQSEFQALIGIMPASGRTETQLQDGVRAAEAAESNVSAKVQVKVAANTIIGIELLAGNNIDAALAAALGKRVIEAQSVAVDTIAGATVSSQIFLKAVAKALYP